MLPQSKVLEILAVFRIENMMIPMQINLKGLKVRMPMCLLSVVLNAFNCLHTDAVPQSTSSAAEYENEEDEDVFQIDQSLPSDLALFRSMILWRLK